ncbi:somatostatin-1-like [Oncorhynchus tshawytscha]|uniref:Somatostatin/Cortistatin C-terminal domain-containing protein n=1 Tax=Oncorhynchus tshawytscha TaxID=74940 RepID=A0A8C8IAV8_ONCTS|nr:somatostatin-1-like [Oncorhynchus tshawytscha]
MALTGIWCAFVLVCVSLCQTGKVDSFGGSSDLKLGHQDKPTWLETLQDKEVSADDKYNLVWLLYTLSQSHHDNTLKINSLPPGPESVGKQESRRETMPQDSRVRKEGCKVFFWKSWTAC